MMTKISNNFATVKLYSAMVLIVVLACSCRHKKNHSLQADVFAAGGGFGYIISQQGKILIKQENIPAVYGTIPFCDSIDAIKVGNLVVQKIENKQSPAITTQDLARLKIKTKC